MTEHPGCGCPICTRDDQPISEANEIVAAMKQDQYAASRANWRNEVGIADHRNYEERNDG